MSDPGKQEKLVVQGVKFTLAHGGPMFTGDIANILQAEPRSGEAIKLSLDRSEAEDTLPLPAESDVVELTLEDDLVLYTSVGRLQDDILPTAKRGQTGEVVLPKRLTFANQRTRSEDGLLVESLKVLDIKSTLLEAAAQTVGEVAARKIAEKIEDQLVGDQSLYRMAENEEQEREKVALRPVTTGDIATSSPLLLFLHGTASSTKGSFFGLWDNPVAGDAVWQELRNKYGKNIFALEHRSLTESPIDNVIHLMEKLPAGCRLHLVSHSRGGLLGELLCRSQFNNSRQPFTKEDISLFSGGKLDEIAEIFGGIKNDYQRHQEQLARLNGLLLQKQPVVERFVRVACPARGTTLASGKLDYYLSGILNVIGLIPALKASVIYDLLKAFTLAVAKERTRPEQLPGLEAMMPGSPFIAMLNSAPESVRAHLAVIKGDVEPVGILKKISMFFLDRFYGSDHDLVVNTPSMDGGARRERLIPVLFDQGKDINHFSYFKNAKTRKGLFSGLTDEAHPPGGFMLEMQQPVYIDRALPRGKKPDDLPAAFILPGITGSHLEIAGDRIWIDPTDLVRGRFAELRFATHPDVGGRRARSVHEVEAEKPVATAYANLSNYLAQDHAVIPFPYDWRSSIAEAGKKLGAAVAARLRTSEKPVRIIAHSMGGLVVRAMMSERKDVWEVLKCREDSRVLMLGTPHRGSHAILRILAGQDRLIKLLAVADVCHTQNELLGILRRFPGVLELLPMDEKGKVALDEGIWTQFKEALPRGWETPLKMDLQWAQKTWDKIFQIELDPQRVFYVAGRARETPVAVEVIGTKSGEKEIIFTATDRGDGRVPWDTGIPPGIRHWYVNAPHGDLADHAPAFKAYAEILETGSTNLLARQSMVGRGRERLAPMLPDTMDHFPSKEQLLAAALGKSAGARREGPELPPLKGSIVHGNLRFANFPLAVGHYHGDTIVSAEAVLDHLLGNRLTQRNRIGIYPGLLNTNEVLLNPTQGEFPGAVIVGLGQVGDLSPGTLTASFRNAVIRYVLQCRETGVFKDKPIGLSALFIGTSAGGLNVRDSLAALVRGVLEANKQLAGPTHNVDDIVAELEFMELYLDVAIEAQHALLDILCSIEFTGRITCQHELNVGNGGRSRVCFREDAEWWQRLRIETTEDGGLKYTILGRQARTDMQIQAVQRQSVEPFLRSLTGQTSADENAGRVLFELLVPRDMKNHATDNRRLVLLVDKGAASYPWELMEYNGREGNEALAIKAGMIRQLTTLNAIPTDICRNNKALVVGDPFAGKESLFPELPGAQKEALAVAKVLHDSRVEVAELVRESGMNVLSRLIPGEYEYVHLAGHGVVDYEIEEVLSGTEERKIRKVTGMLIGPNQFLTPVEINQMHRTPTFVFINCCHLGKIDDMLGPSTAKRYHLAANLATQFIEQGAKAVIAAGWAVDDEAALAFAQTFYAAFFSGESFGSAVQEARRATQEKHPNVNTWGAYQCYGDPDYKITGTRGRDAEQTGNVFVSLAERIAEIRNVARDAATASSAGVARLSMYLQEILQQTPVKHLTDAQLQTVAGDAWGELDQFDKAIAAYDLALRSQNADAPIRCAEQRANFKCRNAVLVARTSPDKAEKLLDEAFSEIAELNKQFGASVERLALLGGTFKRRVEIAVADPAALRKHLVEMEKYYFKSYKAGMELKGEVCAYPLLNALTAKWLLHKSGDTEVDPEQFDALLKQAKLANIVPEVNSEYFWQNIAENDCTLLAALKNEDLDQEKTERIAGTYLRIGKVASSARQMRSVMEHIAFLTTVTEALHIETVGNLKLLLQKLQNTP